MKIKEKKDKVIIFCPKCNWKLINPEDNERTNHCPKCNSWTWEVSQLYHYSNYVKGKEVGREFNLTDNDGNFFQFDDFKEAKKLIDKSFKLFNEVKNER
jgi:DNA-directed RNA polymerase subunit M/transcription elongation factor TFIIS